MQFMSFLDKQFNDRSLGRLLASLLFKRRHQSDHDLADGTKSNLYQPEEVSSCRGREIQCNGNRVRVKALPMTQTIFISWLIVLSSSSGLQFSASFALSYSALVSMFTLFPRQKLESWKGTCLFKRSSNRFQSSVSAYLNACWCNIHWTWKRLRRQIGLHFNVKQHSIILFIIDSERKEVGQGKQRRIGAGLRQWHQSDRDVLHNLRPCSRFHGRRARPEYRVLSEAKCDDSKCLSPELTVARWFVLVALGFPVHETGSGRVRQAPRKA